MKLNVFMLCLIAAATLAPLSPPNLVAEEPNATTQQPDDGLPRFDENDVLQLPANYREWVFVGASLGLRYGAVDKAADESFGHVYINPFGYRAYRQTGEFPEGTMLMLEVARKETKTESELSGTFAGEYTALEAAVKSGDRFDDPWTYFSFDGGAKPKFTPMPTARRFPSGTCIECHQDHAETDHVFTQFYPVFRDVAESE